MNSTFGEQAKAYFKGILQLTDSPLTSSDTLGLDLFQYLTGKTYFITNNFGSICMLYDNIRGQVFQAIRTMVYNGQILS